MNIEHSLKVVAAAVEEFNERDWENFGEIHHENVILTAPMLAEPAQGREAVKAWASGLAATFPDMKWEPTLAFGQGDLVCAEMIATGTHTGILPGPGGKQIPPTYKSVHMKITGIFKVEGDTVSEVRLNNDRLTMLAQLGLM